MENNIQPIQELFRSINIYKLNHEGFLMNCQMAAFFAKTEAGDEWVINCLEAANALKDEM
jgi:hypothetical protein